MAFSWKYFLLPGVAAILYLVAASEIFSGGNRFLTDPATSRHLRAGEIALEQRHILHEDPFSYYQPPLAWIDFEWLFEVSCAKLVQIGGLPLVYSFGVLIFALIPVFFWRLLMGQQILWPVALLYTLAALVFFHSHFLLRPFLFTYLFMLLVVKWWHDHPNGPGLRGWLVLLPVFILWSNVHGGFVAAFVFLGLAILGRAVDQRLKHDFPLQDGVGAWTGFLIAAGLVTLCNPHGWRLHAQIWEMVFRIKSYAAWQEFSPLNFSAPNALAVALLLVAGTSLLSRSGRRSLRWSWSVTLPLLVFLYFGLKVQRHVLLLLIVAAVPVARDWQVWLLSCLSSSRAEKLAVFTREEARNRSHWWTIPLIGAIMACLFIHSPASRDLRVAAFNVSPGTIDYINAHRDHFRRPLTTTWNGGPLAYYLGPNFRISFDDRTDLYGDGRLQPYIGLLQLAPGWEQTLVEGGYDSAILESGYPLTQALAHLPGWRQVRQDALSVIFVHQN
jgi:hypothetical protein